MHAWGFSLLLSGCGKNQYWREGTAVLNTLPASVLLGWNVPHIVKPRDGAGPSETEALAVMKRRGRQLREAGDQPDTHTQAAPTPTVPTPETDDYLSG